MTRIDGVDLLRGVAILLVLMNHVNMRLVLAQIPYAQGMPSQLVSAFVWNGQRGVQIFFTVSGFLITSTTLRRWGDLPRINIRDFYVLRFARIAPLLLALLAILSALDLAHVQDFLISSRTGGLPRALFAALTFHINVLEATRGYLPGNWDILWSLSVEEMFYLFFPLVCRFCGHRKWLVPILLLFVTLGPAGRTTLSEHNEVWREYSYLGSMDAIALGCLTAIFVCDRRLSRILLWIFAAVGISILILTLSVPSQSGLDMTYVAIGTCLIIAVAAQTNWRSPGILSSILRLGQRSYEVYLTHMFVVFAFFHLFLITGRHVWAALLLFPGVIIVATLLGEFVAKFYSEPMNLRLRRSEIPVKVWVG